MKIIILALSFATFNAHSMTQAQALYMINWKHDHPTSAKYDDAFNAAKAKFAPPSPINALGSYTIYCIDNCGFKNLKRPNRRFRVKP